ncbi:lipopolysaccharide biosynthesis protein [uncultured Olegusella sp.]|uniref:lipopolysaccharide biosynthesis protein n=1 Tax=uncultured Olegusella sp. TaxID=1979846 RepID=UPI0026093658|nr:lipopolysaccharide biosynthesis protein [uncultured Olegusella sp.]
MQKSNTTKNLATEAANAAKWSIVTEFVVRLISPITTMVLARVLTPAVFGVVATATMITSLGDMFSDTGFQSYIIQHNFKDRDDEYLSASVAFWTNLVVSLFAVLLIIVFQTSLAEILGIKGLGTVLVVASLSLPITSLVSVQTALYRKSFDFKTLFASRTGSHLLIFFVSVPLAFLGFSYWSMILGTISSNLFMALWLTIQSPWKPRFEYSFYQLKQMFSYGAWILAESVSAWLNTWAGTFIIGALLNSTLVGYYKTSTSICAAVTGIVTSAVLPIVFRSLSILQDDEERFSAIFYQMQKYLALSLVPLALGVFTYRQAFTMIALGPQWLDTSLFMGFWMLASCIVIVFGYMCSEAYRAKGKPKYCTLVQVLYLIPFLPSLYFSAVGGYETISIVVPFVRLSLVVINCMVAKKTLGLDPLSMLYNCRWCYIHSVLAMLPGLIVTAMTDSLIVAIFSIIISIIIYCVLVVVTRDTRVSAFFLMSKLGLMKFLPTVLQRKLSED